MADPHLNDDAVIACADLIGRCGANGFEIGYIRDGVPVEEAGWYAHATFQGSRLIADEHRSPTTAALALAERILTGGTCRCRRPVSLSDRAEGCRWRLVGDRWEPGCNAAPVHVQAARGDYAAMRRAMNEPANRAERRARNRGGRG